MLIVRTSHHPPTRAFLQPILVHGSKVRIGSDLDRWRLFDLEARTVTWVDEIEGTYRTSGAEELIARRRRQLAAAPLSGVSRVEAERTGETMEVAGVVADQWVMRLGTYEREIWLSREPLAGRGFLELFLASEPLSAPNAGVLRDAWGALMTQDGFPVYERSAFQWEGGSLVARRRLVSIESRQLPARLFEIPRDLRDVSPPGMRSAGGRRSAS